MDIKKIYNYFEVKDRYNYLCDCKSIARQSLIKLAYVRISCNTDTAKLPWS